MNPQRVALDDSKNAGIKLIRLHSSQGNSNMSNFTLQQIFGDNAVQDSDTVTLAKSDLSDNSGLSAADQNDGESVFVSLILQGQALGLDTNHRDGNEEFDPNISQQVAISGPVMTLVERADVDGNISSFKRDTYTIDLDVPIQPVSPNDY